MPFMLITGQPVADFLPPILMTVGVVILGWLLLVTVRGKIARRAADQPTPRERIEDLKRGAGAHIAPTEEHMADLLSLTQRLSSQLDAKAARLERLIDLADERITLISATSAETSEFEGMGMPSQPPVTPTPPRRAPASTPSIAPAEVERRNGAKAVANGASDSLSETVYALADDGLAPVEIAQRLEEHTGKIELILALRQG